MISVGYPLLNPALSERQTIKVIGGAIAGASIRACTRYCLHVCVHRAIRYEMVLLPRLEEKLIKERNLLGPNSPVQQRDESPKQRNNRSVLRALEPRPPTRFEVERSAHSGSNASSPKPRAFFDRRSVQSDLNALSDEAAIHSSQDLATEKLKSLKEMKSGSKPLPCPSPVTNSGPLPSIFRRSVMEEESDSSPSPGLSRMGGDPSSSERPKFGISAPSGRGACILRAA